MYRPGPDLAQFPMAAGSTLKSTAFEGFFELMLRCLESLPFSWSPVELVIDRLDGIIGEGSEVATFWNVLAREAVEVLIEP